LEIAWLGHSCFRLRSGEVTVITDPFPDTLGLSMGRPEALIVTISHQHPHHNYVEGLAGTPRVVRGPGEYEFSDIYIKGILTARREGDPPERRNTAYLIEMENIGLCHLGDISSPLPNHQAEELTPTHILFVPVGGLCTLEVTRAVELIQMMSPRVVIPMHYSLPGLKVEKMGPLEPFLKEMGMRDVTPLPKLNISLSSLPEETRVVVLQPQGIRP
jgi:L-ascorbate metabolism protein UlaG (beta-lactamase superfamily)